MRKVSTLKPPLPVHTPLSAGAPQQGRLLPQTQVELEMPQAACRSHGRPDLLSSGATESSKSVSITHLYLPPQVCLYPQVIFISAATSIYLNLGEKRKVLYVHVYI